MKTKVIIKDGHTSIVMTPENDFEVGVLDTAYESEDKYQLTANVDRETKFGVHQSHKFTINLDIKRKRELDITSNLNS